MIPNFCMRGLVVFNDKHGGIENNKLVCQCNSSHLSKYCFKILKLWKNSHTEKQMQNLIKYDQATEEIRKKKIKKKSNSCRTKSGKLNLCIKSVDVIIIHFHIIAT